MTQSNLEIRISLIQGQNSYKQDISLLSLTPSALKLIARIEPRILDKDYYNIPRSERIITLSPRNILDAAGTLHKPDEAYKGFILLPEITSQDKRLFLGQYGHPRHTETYESWLNGCAKALYEASLSRKKKREEALKPLDAKLDKWLDDIIRDGTFQGAVEAPDSEGGWDVSWHALKISYQNEINWLLIDRLKERLQTENCSFRDYMLNHKDAHDLVDNIDREFSSGYAIAVGM